MNELWKAEKQGNDRMTIALVVGAVLGMLAAVVAWNLAGNVFSDCDLGYQGFEFDCEPNSAMSAVFGIVTFASVMLQAFIIGVILKTNVLTKVIARSTLTKQDAVRRSAPKNNEFTQAAKPRIDRGDRPASFDPDRAREASLAQTIVPSEVPCNQEQSHTESAQSTTIQTAPHGPEQRPTLRILPQNIQKNHFLNLYLNPAGRVSRRTWWLHYVISQIIAMIVYGLMAALLETLGSVIDNEPVTAYIFLILIFGTTILGAAIFWVGIIWLFFSFTVKRLHDQDRSAWWILLLLIPVIGWITLFIFVAFLPGTGGLNRYGHQPRTHASRQ